MQETLLRTIRVNPDVDEQLSQIAYQSNIGKHELQEKYLTQYISGLEQGTISSDTIQGDDFEKICRSVYVDETLDTLLASTATKHCCTTGVLIRSAFKYGVEQALSN